MPDKKPEATQVRVRIAPSPTGPLHIGTARTALFNWLFAKKHSGKFILRIEDTDKERSEKKYEEEIIEGLQWLGLVWDEGPYRQSERGEIYKKYLEKLLAAGRAYYCYCTKEELEAERQAMMAQGLPPKYGGHCRNLSDPLAGSPGGEPSKKPEVIRFKTPEGTVEFSDLVRGKIKFDASLLGDMVIAKDLETPLYNIAAVIDDAEMKISHVIRGEDHLSNTPKQILLQKALGFPHPQYAHLPLILGPNRQKLSKRFAETSLLDYQAKGYLPEAVINFMALLGWHTKEDREIFTREELIEAFDLKRVQKAGAIFNSEKLDWLQKEHSKKLSVEDIAERLMPALKKRGIKTTKTFLKKIVEVERARLKTLSEFPDLAGFFFQLPDYEVETLIWQNEPLPKIKQILEEALEIINGVKRDQFKRGNLLSALEDLAKREGRGVVLWPLRVALSGQRASPDPMEIMEVLESKESLRRISVAIEKILRWVAGD